MRSSSAGVLVSCVSGLCEWYGQVMLSRLSPRHPISACVTMASITSITDILGGLANNILFTQLVAFIHICSRIKNQILVVYESQHLPHVTPPLLPEMPAQLVGKICNMRIDMAGELWKALGPLIWNPDKYLADVGLPP